MQGSLKELTPVEYSDSGIKRLKFKVQKDQLCFRLHWHERMELIKLNKGTMEVDIGEEKLMLLPGEIYIIPPKVTHTAIAESDVDYDIIMFDIRSFYNSTKASSELLEPIFNGNAKFHFKTNNPDIGDCYSKLMCLHEKDCLLAISLTYQLLDLLLKNCLLQLSSCTKSDTVVSAAIKYIEENYKENISTKALAAKFGYSCEHFCRKFKAETWLSPIKYLKIYRLEMSAAMIKEKKHTITEIAAMCGFDDANYFTRCFKAHFGYSPTEYSRKNFKD